MSLMAPLASHRGPGSGGRELAAEVTVGRGPGLASAPGGAARVAEQPVVALRGVSIAFGSVQALTSVDLEIFPGEVHVLLGENGAGKSTLIKILAGVHRPDEGDVSVEGLTVAIQSPHHSQSLGIAVIHQELALVPHLSVAENIVLGREPRAALPGFVARRQQNEVARRALSLIGFSDSPNEKVARLTTANQQLVEIAKALSQRSRILVMDEPTASISEREAAHLYGVIADLKRQGVAIVFISHRMREVFALADRITVLRDGRRILTTQPGETTPDALIQAMVGRALGQVYQRRARREPGPAILEVKGLRSAAGLNGVDLCVRSGEVVGLAGLVGAGRTEVARAVMGLDARTGGEVLLHGEPFAADPVSAVRRGVAFVPESRKEQGLALQKSVCDNLTLAALWKLFPSGLRSRRVAGRLASDLVGRLRIVTPSATLAGATSRR